MTPEGHMERRRAFFSSLKEGDTVNGEITEYLDDHTALVDISGFLVRCVMKNIVPAGKKVSLVIHEINREKNLVVMKLK
ncbi:MAG: hypothetical protein R6W70_01265 [bacterium]